MKATCTGINGVGFKDADGKVSTVWFVSFAPVGENAALVFRLPFKTFPSQFTIGNEYTVTAS